VIIGRAVTQAADVAAAARAFRNMVI
jgi:3-keto-L-gulonate-6-phosphate decarboxylase